MHVDWASVGRILAVGTGLFYGVMKFFDAVGGKLNDNTKLEIAVWLYEWKKIPNTLQNWPGTFARVFDRVFGERHLSWRCFWRSTLASYLVLLVSFSLLLLRVGEAEGIGAALRACAEIPGALLLGLFSNVMPDYVSLLETRFTLSLMRNARSTLVITGLVCADLLFSILCAGVAAIVWTYGESVVTGRIKLSEIGLQVVVGYIRSDQRAKILTYVVPAFFTSIWVWLYASSGFVLRAARHLDMGFNWFDRHFDVEKQPLQCIGLVAGALVAVVYWAAVIVSRLL